MTFVRRPMPLLSKRGRRGHRDLEPDFSSHFRSGYGARSRHLLLLYMGQRFDDSTTDGTRGVGDGPRFTGREGDGKLTHLRFSQDVLLLRPF